MYYAKQSYLKLICLFIINIFIMLHQPEIIYAKHINSNLLLKSGLGSNPDVEKMKNESTTTCNNNFEKFCLKRELLMGILKNGWEKPTRIQDISIPIALSGRDIIVRSKNETGKTGSFCISILDQIDPKENLIQALILEPTRAMAFKTSYVFVELAKHMDIRIIVATGGTHLRDSLRQFDQPAQVVVATPGRILDFMKRNVVKLDHCRILVLDEADMLCQHESIDSIISKLPQERQTLLYSNKFPLILKKMKDQYLKDPYEINLIK